MPRILNNIPQEETNIWKLWREEAAKQADRVIGGAWKSPFTVAAGARQLGERLGTPIGQPVETWQQSQEVIGRPIKEVVGRVFETRPTKEEYAQRQTSVIPQNIAAGTQPVPVTSVIGTQQPTIQAPPMIPQRQGRVYNPSTNQFESAPTSAVMVSAMTPGTSVHGGRVYSATPPATSMKDFLAQTAGTDAVMQTGIGSTQQAQERVLRQSQLDQLRREQMAIGLTGKQIMATGMAGKTAQESEIEKNKIMAQMIPAIMDKSGASLEDATEQAKSILGIGGQPVGGQPTIDEPHKNISSQAPKGSATIQPMHEKVWDELMSDYEKTGFDVGRLPPQAQQTWDSLRKMYPYLTLPKRAKV